MTHEIRTPVNCPLCGSTTTLPLSCPFPGVFRCACHFIFAMSTLDSSTPELYDEEWARSELAPTFGWSQGRFVIRNEWKLTSILDRLERFRQHNRLLDVGCSAAFFLKVAKDRGWDVRGVEVSAFGVRFSRETLGLDVFQGTLHEASFPSGSFDVVFSSHVLEHIGNPRDVVREMRRILRSGGALVSIVPTQFSTPSFRLLGQMTGEGPPRHVSFFSRATFDRLITGEGFTVVYSRQNVELQTFVAAVRGLRSRSLVAVPGVESQATSMASKPAVVVRAIKACVNWLGTVSGLGDELFTIAVKW